MAGTGIDVLEYVGRQPGLLLSENWAIDLSQLQAQQDQDQAISIQQMVQAWEHGLSSDTQPEWEQR